MQNLEALHHTHIQLSTTAILTIRMYVFGYSLLY